jgi:hypothetical protein
MEDYYVSCDKRRFMSASGHQNLGVEMRICVRPNIHYYRYTHKIQKDYRSLQYMANLKQESQFNYTCQIFSYPPSVQ